MNGQWTKEQAWSWYNSKPWIRAATLCRATARTVSTNGRSSASRISLRLRLARLSLPRLSATTRCGLYSSLRFGISSTTDSCSGWTATLHCFGSMGSARCLCSRRLLRAEIALAAGKIREQKYDIGYHGGKKNSPHKKHGELSWHLLDDPDIAARYYEFVKR